MNHYGIVNSHTKGKLCDNSKGGDGAAATADHDELYSSGNCWRQKKHLFCRTCLFRMP